MLEGKLTLPVLYALNSTNSTWAQEIAVKVKEGIATPDAIGRLVDFTKSNGGIEYAVKMMELYKGKALDLLHSLPPSEVCTALEAYLDYVVDRDK